MKFLISLWKISSFPLIVGGLALSWYGIHNWSLVSADKVVSAKELFASHSDVALLKDSLRFDLRYASIRQENFMGVKSPATAVFPAWLDKDTGKIRLVVISSRPTFLGPVIKSFQRVDSVDGAVNVKSSSKTSSGTLVPQFDALIQVLAGQLQNNLANPVKGRFLAEGTAVRKTDATDLGIDSVASEYWEVRLEGVPSREKVLTLFAIGLAAIMTGIAQQMVVKKWETKRAEHDEEERSNEKPLV